MKTLKLGIKIGIIWGVAKCVSSFVESAFIVALNKFNKKLDSLKDGIVEKPEENDN